jgi:hypothetical protein
MLPDLYLYFYQRRKTMKPIKFFCITIIVLCTLFSACDDSLYGSLGGADTTQTYVKGGNKQGDDTQDGNTQGGDAQGGDTQSEDTQDGDSQGGDTQVGHTQDEDTQGGDSQGGNTQDGNTQGGDSQGGNTQGEDTQGGDSQGGNTQGGNTQGEDTQDGDTQDEDTQGGDTQDEDTEDESLFEQILNHLSGIWYSHWAGIGRLDGYRIGKWGTNGSNFESIVDPAKLALFPNRQTTYVTYTNYIPEADDYFIFYDGTVYGEADDGTGGQPILLSACFVGIVRALNIFNNDRGRGALIVEYLRGYPQTQYPEAKDGSLPFYGVYFKELNKDCIQMANPVNWPALHKGGNYYTGSATLEEAIVENSMENEAEFVDWGITIPQDREPVR